MIDIIYLQQLYEQRKILEIRQIDGKSNLANAMTNACTLCLYLLFFLLFFFRFYNKVFFYILLKKNICFSFFTIREEEKKDKYEKDDRKF